MAAPNPVKAADSPPCQIVGVIVSAADLQLAVETGSPPDYFELRLDHFAGRENELEEKIPFLKAPLIMTARHPAEGGANNLSANRRRELLARFLPFAQYIDVELRSVEAFRPLLDLPAAKSVLRIISSHDLNSTPSPRSLHAKTRTAKSYGAAVVKLATRTDTPAQLARLLEFIAEKDPDVAVSIMGIGKLGGVARLILAQCGSVLAYGALAEKQVEGQLSVEELRAGFRLLGIS